MSQKLLRVAHRWIVMSIALLPVTVASPVIKQYTGSLVPCVALGCVWGLFVWRPLADKLFRLWPMRGPADA